MSIELYEARRKLDIFEKGVNNPEIFMSTSFAGIFDNLLRGITVNQKGVLDYVEDYLNQLDIFRETKIDVSLECITVSLPSIDEDNSYDRIIWISFENHTYKVLNKSIKQYREVMNKTYTYEPQEIRDIFKRYENYSLMKIGYNESNRYNLFIIIILIGLFLHKLNKRQFNVYNDTG